MGEDLSIGSETTTVGSRVLDGGSDLSWICIGRDGGTDCSCIGSDTSCLDVFCIGKEGIVDDGSISCTGSIVGYSDRVGKVITIVSGSRSCDEYSEIDRIPWSCECRLSS